jgi:hypothetical protein
MNRNLTRLNRLEAARSASRAGAAGFVVEARDGEGEADAVARCVASAPLQQCVVIAPEEPATTAEWIK